MNAEPDAAGLSPSRGWLLGLFALALALRGGSAWFASTGSPFWSQVNVDDRAYHEWALRIAGGQWSDGEVFFLSPLYPYALGALYRLFGASMGLAVVLQCILSAAMIPILAALGGRLFGSRAGLLTGLLGAFYGPLIFFSECLLSETLHLFLVCAGLLQLQRAASQGRLATAFGAGGLLGLAAVARAYFLASGVLLGLWLWWMVRQQPGRRALPMCFALGLLLALAPSALHNRWAGGSVVLVNSSGGINFFLGNHAGANGRIHPPPGVSVEGLLTPDKMRETFALKAQTETGQTMGAAELSSHYYSEARAWMLRHPGDWLSLLGLKLRQVVEAFEYPGDRNAYQAQRWSPILRWTPVGWTLVLSLAVGACCMSTVRQRGVGLVHVINGLGLVVLLAFLVTDRFRLVLIPGCLLLAGIGADGLMRARGESPRLGAMGRLLVLATVSLSLSIGAGRPKESYMSHYNLALKYDLRGDLVQSETCLRDSLLMRPGFMRGHLKLAEVLQGLGRASEAQAEVQIARRLAREQGIRLGPEGGRGSQAGSGEGRGSPPKR
ncbi:MAG: glycosyltransferase family 39 protein [Planctomycetota bacterium]|nr:glycosyltransferase family 39 protein [Planctomycetota bacterium]